MENEITEMNNDTSEHQGLLGATEREMMLAVTGQHKPLGYPRHPMKMADGQDYEEYEIPEADKRKVFEELYLFDNVPAMDEVMLDMHSDTQFRVSDYKAIRQDGGNFLVAPLYANYGGTLLDWMPVRMISKSKDDKEIAVCVVAQEFKRKDGDDE